MESFYYPLGVFVLLPFVQQLIPKLKFWGILYGFFFIIKLVLIIQTASLFTQKIDCKRIILNQTAHLDSRKLLVNNQDICQSFYDNDWASPYEFWLLSALEMEEQRSILLYDSLPQVQHWNKYKISNAFITKWGAIEYSKINSPYFEFNDTSSYVFYSPSTK
jgi:hypothetical protein